MERVAYGILAVLALIWLAVTILGVVAIFPFGLLGLAVLIAIGLLFATAVRDRLRNKEDDYYSANVDQ